MVYVISCTFSKSYYELILIYSFEQKYCATCSGGDLLFVYSICLNRQGSAWKLMLYHIYSSHISNIKYISIHHSLRMNEMLDFICIGFSELWGREASQKLKLKIFVTHRKSNMRHLASESDALNPLAMLNVDGLHFKLLH